ncbi:LysR substrate-binding domain-containing protein [Burkholderia oklahomensis]|uniref:LysR substrate-binding domain-containing protein n=1 Tax=Burkholderia oklahomensis TaxID=342113 RepID=UPI00265711BF|nr:LysR substrate-binding domain-containing protein [Burkholderia oklahomensis]MDN7676436.1 LysR substrate-binding domain-containing protein [Burkholderia oklahomensis]
MADNLKILRTLPSPETLACFEAAARTNSFTRAARELALTQSAVSKQIKALEDALQCTLFDRHARGIQLNNTGMAFQEEIAPMLHNLERAVVRFRHQQQGQAVSIACTQAVAHFWLFPRVVRFNQKHPDITVSVVSINAINERACNECDLGILYGDGDWASLESTRLFPEIVYPICRADLQIRSPAQPGELAELPLVQLDSRKWDCIDWQDWFRHFGIDYTIPQNAITFNEVTLAFNAATEGLGVCLGWDFMAKQAIEAGVLRKLGDFQYDTGRFDYLVSTKNRPLSKSAKTLRDWLAESNG